jgi:hypothetical protein
MGLQHLLNQGPHLVVEIFASRMHVLRNIVGIVCWTYPQIFPYIHKHNIRRIVYLFIYGLWAIHHYLFFPTRIFIEKECSSIAHPEWFSFNYKNIKHLKPKNISFILNTLIDMYY